MTPRRSSLGLASVVTALVVIAAACSSDQQSSATAASTSPTTSSAETTVAAASTAPPTTLTIITTPQVASTTAPGQTAPPTPSVNTIPASTMPSPTPRPTAATLRGLKLKLEPFVDIPLLTGMVQRTADKSLYFATQDGTVVRVKDGTTEPEVVLDLTAETAPFVAGSERGLLGINIGPVDDRLYLYWTDLKIDSHLDSWAFDANGLPDPATRREVIYIDQPDKALGHKGGPIIFAPNGDLYLGLGDGGGSNGRDAQDYSKLFGGLIRIIPNPAGDGYAIPPDNPYVGQAGIRPEIWAKGMREPFGACMDPATGDIWTADVGNDTMEEVDRLPAGVGGLNFGWYFIEGTQVNHPGAPANAVPPVWAYRHTDVGPAAIGGCIYHGTAIPDLVGAYVFLDFTGVFLSIGADDQPARLNLSHKGVVTGLPHLLDGEFVLLTQKGGAFKVLPG